MCTLPHAVTTPVVKSAWVMKDAIWKIEFPYPGQQSHSYPKFAVTDWQFRVLSTQPWYWFCEKLIAIEAAAPGSAESAYRKFKKIMKEIPAARHKGMTIELLADSASAILPDWAQERLAGLFVSTGHNPDFGVLYTEKAEDHLVALELSQFLQCNLALADVQTEKPAEQLCLLN